MKNGNIGYLYYKKYYEEYFEKGFHKKENNGDIKKQIEECFNKINKEILESSNIDSINDNLNKLISNKSSIKLDKPVELFYLKTTYPGVLLGSGYKHSINKIGEFKLGFEFDYTTGLPIINGSSIKGVLRSVFGFKNDSMIKEKKEYIKEIMVELNIQYSDDDFEKIALEIFEGKSDDINIPISYRDIFFEAVIDMEETKRIFENKKNEKGQILGEDFITPHFENPLKNPEPLKFIKVMPNIVWRFQFNLKDYFYYVDPKDKKKKKKLYLILASDKKRLFEKIIMDFGIGAKTNVGYGALVKYELKNENNRDTEKDSIDNSKNNSNKTNNKKNYNDGNANKRNSKDINNSNYSLNNSLALELEKFKEKYNYD